MRIQVANKKVYLKLPKKNLEIHPFWLRERVNVKNLVDKNTDQRLYDPSDLNHRIKIKKTSIDRNSLKVEFSDGVKSNYKVKELIYELKGLKPYESITFWDSSLKKIPSAKYEKHMFRKKVTYNFLQDFYKYGFVVIKKTPRNVDFLVNFANSIGVVRPTNWGIYFTVRSMPNANDLAYTSLPLKAHTDNPYRKPVPCVQLLHCIENEVEGGLSTIVDGFAVADYMKKKYKDLFEVLTKTKVRFRFIDKNIILENWGELIELDKKGEIIQIRHSSRLDYVPILEKRKLDKFYKARKLFSSLCESKNFEIKFKMSPGDLIIFDNHRTLHGRTAFNVNEGKRHLKGCYIDHDSTEGRLRHLERKFRLKWRK
tara:strand:- start:1880 stop:2986 length:1107 start_codon:yes stop_codon:yes gene_type:complete